MASNDDPIEPTDVDKSGVLATIERIIHAPALPNAQTPLRIAALLVLTVCVSLAPYPASVIGVLAIVTLALSLGQVQQKGKT